MMDISADKVAEVIILAREGDAGEDELVQFIKGMRDEEQASLVALFWIGRGSFETAEFEEAVATARQEATVPTAQYLLGSPHLADHLEAGLEALGISSSSEEDALY
ncbi:DUF3775 domain-containing protein [Roseisalinus antarcticus]|uniref:DUF3775 domain-containing protein n=1 Tax=Roseisalinus antarcticus TaxID=254357 RepID=A0A1Y5SLQ4_9RHOB|nr:DUF3775 domain-containing protein [Roseisalinus antarcticus]SLN43681.1 hypothetical protein ROA7023_01790 [Roseisalinus antarcticus]